MTTYVAFLRAINVGGHGVVKMTVLRNAFTAAGCKEARTLLASGNVVFEAPTSGIAALTRRIQTELSRLFEKPPGLFIRTVRDIAQLAKTNPFRRYTATRDLKLYVAFLSQKPRKVPRLPLRDVPEALELIGVKNREAFIVSGRKKNGMGGFPNLFIEQELDVTATSRNWNTITKIAGLADGS